MLDKKKTFIMLGSGGVGKTTLSCLLAIRGAQQGKKVALFSIDPAKRLADALGIDLSGELLEINLPEVAGSGGSVSGAMLDQKKVFDSMVLKYSKTKKSAQQIFENPVYRAVSSNMSGPLEYMALAKLSEIYLDDRFDMIVLDTPPFGHTLDFINRPNLLAGFQDNQVMNLLVKPYSLAMRFGLSKALPLGGKLMGGLAEVTGAGSLQRLCDFLLLMQDVIKGFHQSSVVTTKIFKDSSTCFGLVVSPTDTQIEVTREIVTELSKATYEPELVIKNRCVPAEVIADEASQNYEPLRLRMQQESSFDKALLSILQAGPGGEFSGTLLDVPEKQPMAGDIEGLAALAMSLGIE